MSTTQVKYTRAEWCAKATEMFGEDFMKWKFVCPICGHVATVQGVASRLSRASRSGVRASDLDR